MPEWSRDGDWTRSPARTLAGIVLVALAAAGAGVGWLEGRAPADDARPVGVERVARLIDVNTADVAELDLLPRIGPKRAAAIVAERERGGPFRSLEDLERVHGIGPRTVEGLRGLAAAGPTMADAPDD